MKWMKRERYVRSKISSRTSSDKKVDDLTPFPKMLCDNCYGIIQLTSEFRESILINDKQLNDFAKLYFSSEIIPTSNGAVPEETRATEPVICNTELQESHVQPIIRVRNDLFQNKVINTDSSQTTNDMGDLSSLEKQNEQAPPEHENCDLLNTNESISKASMETIIIDDEDVLRQSNDSPEIDGITNDLYIDETAYLCDQDNVNESKRELREKDLLAVNLALPMDQNSRISTESIDTIILDYEDSPQQSNVCQVLPMERANDSHENIENDPKLKEDLNKNRQNRSFSNDDSWEIIITCESPAKDIENMSNTNYDCKKQSNKHKKTPPKHNAQIKREIADDQEDIKFSKRIKFEDGLEYNCDQCSKFFMSKKKLYCHKRVHNKKYECIIAGCKKTFATKGDLQKHTRTHTGERPYECDLCDKKFRQKILLRYHKGSIHGIKIKKTDEENDDNI
ncbi:zinc finger protein 567-like isoform X2 [Pieris brassicae]|uniref:zinc finger protein 567-like isoform X2 n=1 Tax=Pieris brassicae TaxID=7116 RepID=UPI001E65FF99|nr:zinc finger protein 567-like isoform X2 [Pieris brassicae]